MIRDDLQKCIESFLILKKKKLFCKRKKIYNFNNILKCIILEYSRNAKFIFKPEKFL